MNYIGIDLGTTNSVGCIFRHGKFEYLKFGGKELLPSAILYNDGKITVGNAAKRRSVNSAEKYISSAKTYMGDLNKTWQIDDKTFSPTDVAAEVLKEIYKVAKKHFGNDEEIQAVITTPAYFSGDQNSETKKAGEAAGFKVKQILAEPVAAALAYAFEDSRNNEKIYVVDLGGGTFDVSLLEYTKSKDEYRTLMKDGDRKLGGDNFDEVIADMMMSEIRKTIGVDLSTQENSGLNVGEYARARQKIFMEAEKVKCNLSQSDSEDVNLVNLFSYRGGLYDLQMKITREDFLHEANALIRRIENIIRRSFDELDFDESEVDRVILVGGSANMPFVRDCVKKFFDKEPYADKDLSKLVAMGAALRADNQGDSITVRDIISWSLGIEVIGNRFAKILEKNREYPCENEERFYTTYDYQDEVRISVYEGEDTEDVTQNRYIGGFMLDNIAPGPRGMPIDVTFEFDESSILHVTAKDPNTGSRRQVKMDRTKPQEKDF